jgi:probable phosphoglycerate mutase
VTSSTGPTGAPTGADTVLSPAPPPSPLSALDRAFLLDALGLLILVRHGQQQWPTEDPAPASAFVDPPLSALGRRQAELVGEHLAEEHVDAVYSSHLRRAADTAKEIGRHHGLEPQIFQDLREVEMFGRLEPGTKARDVVPPEVLIGARARFVVERRWDVFPYTESSADFSNRVVRVIEGILAVNPDRRVVIACHGGVINAYLSHLLQLRADMFFQPAHASVHRVRAGDGRRVVHSLNELHHLEGSDPKLVTF